MEDDKVLSSVINEDGETMHLVKKIVAAPAEAAEEPQQQMP